MKTTVFAIMISFCVKYNAQTISPSTISSYGGSVSSSSITIDYSFGETINTSVSNSTNTISQGFLQPELAITTGIIAIKENQEVTVYPNPSIDFIKIESTDAVNWVLIDSQSKIIKSGSEQEINTSHFSAGVYFLSISSSKNQYIKTIKIIKN